METTITILRDNAPFAAMLLLAVLYLKQDVTGLRSDIDEDLTELKSEMSQDIAGLKSEMRQDIAGLRSDMDRRFTEMGQDIAKLRSDTDRRFTEVRSDIAGLGERMARVETRLGSIEKRLDRPPSPSGSL